MAPIVRALGVAFLATLLFVAAASSAARATALDALVFVSKPTDVISQTAPPKPAPSIDATRVPALASPRAAKLFRSVLGQQIDAKLLDGLRTAVQGYFVSIKQPYASIVFPAQDVTGGVLQVLVTVGRVGTIRVRGNRWFDTKFYTDALHVKPGQIPESATLDADVDWLNQSPYRQVRLEAAAGTRIGTTDLTLQTQDRFPVSFYAGIDNTGNPSTGLTRLSTGFDWGNAFFRGDDFGFGYTTSDNGASLRQYALSYATYLPSHASFSVAVNSAFSQSLIAASPTSTTGFNNVVSFRYDTPLPQTPTFDQSLSAGADYKSANNNLLFGGVSVFPTTTVIDQLVLGYSPSLSDGWGSTSLALAVYLSPGGLSANNSDATFSSQQAGATARYAYANVSLDRTTTLAGGWSWRIHVQTQIANAILLPSEELLFGGYGSIRGFNTAFATRDDGTIVSTELHARPFPLGVPRWLGITGERDRFDPYVFVDYGTGWNHGELAETYLQMLSLGPGFGYQFGPRITGRFDYGFALQHIGLPPPGGQADLAVQLRY